AVFANDLLVDPTSRGVTDITHVLAGIASSSSLTAAKQLVQAINGPLTCRIYDKYSDLVLNPDIDIVYIASPHSHHFQNAMLALEAGKHVLCEKPLTVNADQARKLFSIAAKKGLFLMEGMWTRFQPIGNELHRALEDRTIGSIIRVFADNGLGVDDSTEWPPAIGWYERNSVEALCWIVLGAYPIQWILQILGPNHPLDILSTVSKHVKTGVDESVSILMTFASCEPTNPDILTIANASISAADNYDGNTPVVRIQGETGEIQLFGPAWRPSKIRVFKREQKFVAAGSLSKTVENEMPDVQGLCFEADEAARCIREGRVESPLMPWHQSLIAMQIMDKVRKDNNLQFSSDIESLDYPLTLSSSRETGL
ncbi:dimeric dihydrodiol dehydrogenase, partial [Penicillium herquei]